MSSSQNSPRTPTRAPRGTLRIAALVIALVVAAGAAAQSAWPPAPPLPKSALQDAGRLPPSIVAQTDEAGLWDITFRHKPAAANALHVAGSFNGWNAQALAMSGPDAEGFWRATIKLGAGDYQYKFVVDGTRWFHDPLNADTVSDGHSGFNSVLKIGPVAQMTESRGRVGDGEIDVPSLAHDARVPTYFQALAHDRVLIRYRTLAHDVSRVWVALKDGPQIEMAPAMENAVFAYWEATLELPGAPDKSAARTLEYTFVLQDGAKRAGDPLTYTRTLAAHEVFETPDWARHAIWYQIMVDRFRNGDPANDPDKTVSWTMDWFARAPFEGRDGATFYKHDVYFRLYGGDLAGVEQKLSYLKDLGINALYLNPVFKAPSHHKYDAESYLHIDDHFGVKGDYEAVAATEDWNDPKTWKWTETDRRFLALIRTAKSLGFRIILDGVFNHLGVQSVAFQDVMKNRQHSRYADWFDVTAWEPFAYNGWAGVDTLPAFKKTAIGFASEQVKQHIFNVTRRWMDPDGDGDPRDGVDGWRLDVPNEVPAPFWVEWRQVVKSINPDAYITGEIWDRADAWLDGRHFDAVMNYQFAQQAVAWIGHKKRKIKVSQIDRRLAELRLAYPAAATYVMQNLVDSHDTDRLVSQMRNPDRAYDQQNRVQDNGPNYDNSKPTPAEYARARLVALLQMTYVGAPMIWYGDEAGMWGADDPTCRKPMLWEDLRFDKPQENAVMSAHTAFYREVIALRNAHVALRDGTFRTLLADDSHDVWAFERSSAAERVIVVLNASDTAQRAKVPLAPGAPGAWRIVFGGTGERAAEAGFILVEVPPVGGVVMVAK